MAKYDWQIPTKKKKHKGLIIFLIIFGILVVLPVGFVFGAFYTTETKQVSDKEVHYENIVTECFSKGLAKLDEKHPQIDFTINEEMFDGILMAACDKINQKQFIPKMYCYINDNDYTFTIDLQASFFKTRVLLYTSLDSSGEGFEKTLTFKINGITVGRLPIPINWITGIMSNFINDNMLNSAFEQSGFHIKSDLAHAQLTYDRLTFREDIYNYLMKVGKQNSYLDLLLSMFGNDEVLKVNYKNGITASFKLDELRLPELITPLNFTELDKHRDKIVEWMNKGDTYLTEGDVPTMFSYLIRGYKYSSYDIRQYVDGLNEKPIKAELLKYINDETTTYSDIELNEYEGSKINEEGVTFKNFCAIDEDQSKEIDVSFSDIIPNPPSVNFSIAIDSLNKYLIRTMDKAIGMTIPLTYTDENNKWCFAYVVVDNLFVDFQENEGNATMTLYLVLNISGVRVALELITDDIKIVDTNPDPETVSIGKLHFNLKEAYFGVIPLGDISLLDNILTMIPSAENVFTYQKTGEQRSFSINLDKVLPSTLDIESKKAIAKIIGSDQVKSTPTVEDGCFKLKFEQQI